MYYNILSIFVFLVCIFVLCFVYSVFYIVLCIVSPTVYNCLFSIFVQIYRSLPQGENPIALNIIIIIIIKICS